MENISKQVSTGERKVDRVKSAVRKNVASMKLLNEAGTKAKLEIQMAMSGLHDALRIRELSLMDQVDSIVQAERMMLMDKQAKLCEAIGRMSVQSAAAAAAAAAADDDDSSSSGGSDEDDAVKSSSSTFAHRLTKASVELKMSGNQDELRKRILNFGKVVHAKKRNESFEVISKGNSEFYTNSAGDRDVSFNDKDEKHEDDEDEDSSSSSSSISSSSSFPADGEKKKKKLKILRATPTTTTTEQTSDKKEEEFLKKWLKSLGGATATTGESDRTGTHGCTGGSGGDDDGDAAAQVYNPLKAFVEKMARVPLEFWLSKRTSGSVDEIQKEESKKKKVPTATLR